MKFRLRAIVSAMSFIRMLRKNNHEGDIERN